jgi:tripartite-type tricarboxylate transporter receptor subunit TctC
MALKRMNARPLVVVSLILLSSFSLAFAQEYPTRSITVIVNAAPGGPSDIIARGLAEHASKALGQPVVAVNRSGGGGTVGVNEMVRAKPDGYTIGTINMPALAVMPHMQRVPYDPLKDVAHICVLQPYEYGIYSKADAPWNSLKELVEYAAKNPGKVFYGSGGVGSTNHLIMVRLGLEHNLNWKHVTYGGDAEVLTAMLGGHVQAASGTSPTTLPHLRGGKVKLLVVTNKDRWPYVPEVPTLLELGYKFYQSSFLSLGAPAGIPEPVRAKLEDTFRKILQDPAVKEQFQTKLYARLNYMSGADYGKYIREEFAFYKDFLKQQGIQ